MSIPYLTIFLMLACAIFYYKAGEIENTSGILWACMSLATFFLTWYVFHWGTLGNLLGQVGLLGIITMFRVLRDYRGGK